MRTSVLASRRTDSTTFMKFPLNASSNVSFGGNVYLHSVLMHRFGSISNTTQAFNLVARARQFSSFVLLVGKIADANTFAPECAMVIKDKDELKIPLMLETMPSAKEFKDAISSLSQEQQRFCKAYRSKQLASSVFAVCAIEIKAQMEKVLNLPEDSLTKELALSNSLVDLFVTYQISPDLLSFDGDDKISTREKIKRVQENNDAIRKVVDAEKQAEIEEAKQRQEKVHAIGNMGDMLVEGAYNELCLDRNISEEEECEELDGCYDDSDGDEDDCFDEEKDDRFVMDAPKVKTKEQDNESSKLQDLKDSTNEDMNERNEISSLDYTKLPAILNKQFERLDVDNAIRPTKIKTSSPWVLNRQKGLLSNPKTEKLSDDDQTKERNAAYDLLDALTRSGVLTIECAQFHVVVAATHCFELNLMDTIIQRNVNPIEKVERSHTIMTSTVFGQSSVEKLIKDSEVKRILGK